VTLKSEFEIIRGHWK